MRTLLLTTLLLLVPWGAVRAEGTLRVAVFDVDATPPVGAAMAYDRVKRIDEMTLRCRGIVLLGADTPIVLSASGWKRASLSSSASKLNGFSSLTSDPAI